jgi:hypothetical protein
MTEEKYVNTADVTPAQALSKNSYFSMSYIFLNYFSRSYVLLTVHLSIIW